MSADRGDPVSDLRRRSLCPEVKTRERLPSWLLEAVAQAEASAKAGQTPIAVIHQCGKGYQDALVVLRLSDFEAWLGSTFGRCGDAG